MEQSEKVRLLLEILFDPAARVDEKDDAAEYLQDCDDDLALAGLSEKGRDSNEDSMVLYSCGNSMAQIWMKRDFFDYDVYQSLDREARWGLFDNIKGLRPGWVEKYRLAEDWEKKNN